MPQLSDTQSILLAHAARRERGSLLPLPTTITSPAAAVAKSLAALVKRGLAEERATGEPNEVHRSDGDLRYGLYLTAAGRAAIGMEQAPEGATVAIAADPGTKAPPAPRVTKSAMVLELLGREGGATLPELVAATGWLPHTTRAALTGLRKKGHVVEKTRRDEATCYKLAGAR